MFPLSTSKKSLGFPRKNTLLKDTLSSKSKKTFILYHNSVSPSASFSVPFTPVLFQLKLPKVMRAVSASNSPASDRGKEGILYSYCRYPEFSNRSAHRHLVAGKSQNVNLAVQT